MDMVTALNLPAQPTPFIGRDKELKELGKLLADPTCRLVSLVAAGGSGKTRLATEIARWQIDSFPDGVYFVDLQAITSTEDLPSAIADAINMSVHGLNDIQQHLLETLSDRQMLLVLDNFEHILDGAEFLAEMLQAAPYVKLLVTSREVLNLQEEWIYSVRGMPYPDKANGKDLSSYSAVQLFADRAQRVRQTFSLDDEKPGITRICQLVEGYPLALELAASWVKTLDTETIADEIQRNIDFLSTNLRNIPERHRSMQAVFWQSWQFLSEQEKQVFKQLSVFRGGFSREAAETVAAASLHLLTNLVDKSLLWIDADGRFQIHELLRQYAADRLVEISEQVDEAYQGHCIYFSNFLQDRVDSINGGKQLETVLEIETESENVRAAVQWAIEHRLADVFTRMVYVFSNFCQFQSRYQEAFKVFEHAVKQFDQPPIDPTLAKALAHTYIELGWYYVRFGRYDEAHEANEKGNSFYTDYGLVPIPGIGNDPLIQLGVLALNTGDYDAAQQYGETARETTSARGDRINLAGAFYILTSAYLAKGELKRAYKAGQQAYELCHERENLWFLAYVLNELGNVVRVMGDYEKAKDYFEYSYAIRETFEDAEGMAAALVKLGEIAALQGKYDEAQQFYQQSQDMYADINDRGGLGTAYCGLGEVAFALRNYQEAARNYYAALEIGSTTGYMPLVLSVLIGIGQLEYAIGEEAKAVEILSFVQQHPSIDHQAKVTTDKLLATWQSDIDGHIFEEAVEVGRSYELSSLVEALLTRLSSHEDISQAITAANLAPGAEEANQALIEPLTAREIEVLQLISEGLTNQQIAEKLVIAVGSVKWYTSQIYGKLEANSRTHAVAKARELHLLP